MLFGRGTWSVCGVEPTSLQAFTAALNDPNKMLQVSQLTASVATKFQAKGGLGINPFSVPRKDELLTNASQLNDLNEFLELDEVERLKEPYPVDDVKDYIGMGDQFSIGNKAFGLWVVFNEYEDVTDEPSRKEGVAYDKAVRPFKFLSKEEKKQIEQLITASSVSTRKQFPVIVDLQHGRVYAATSNKDEIYHVRALLTDLGCELFSLRWDFKGNDWPTQLLNKINSKTRFKAEMQQRAEDLTRFSKKDVEKFEDPNIEKIVSTFFALSELESSLWAGLTKSAKIRIHPGSDPASTNNPSVAFTLLRVTDDAELASSSVMFQELIVSTNRKGEERQVRNNLFSLDVNDNINEQDAGVALLKGFDLPQFKKKIKQALKAQGELSIKDFWNMWLGEMENAILVFIDNATDLLEVDKKQFGLCSYNETSEEAANG
jgi:hypothetical protein